MHRPTFLLASQLERWQWLSLDELRAMQLRKLNELLSVALGATQYGRLTGVEKGWRARNLEDLRRLPLMDKAFISAHREELVNRDVPGGALPYHTGGSTGTPLSFYLDRRRQAWDKAARIRTHRWWGINPGNREAYVWNSPVELEHQGRMKRFRDWLLNDCLLSASGLSSATIGTYVRRLRRFKAECLFGYPSSMCLMARLARQAGIELQSKDLRVIFTTAELLHDHQRALLKEAFGGVAVADGYGSREAGFIAHQCPAGRMHITSENMVVEFIKDGRPASAGEDAEVVVTQLDNHAMPFLRYRTGDIGQYSAERCECGRGLEVMQVVKGRSNDLLRTFDGRWIHGSALSSIIGRIGGVAAFQFRQHRDMSVELLLVPTPGFTSESQERLRAALLVQLGMGMRLEMRRCDMIPRLVSGKLQYVVSELDSEESTCLVPSDKR